MSILSDWKIITVQLDNEATDLNLTELASISPELTQWLMAGGSNVSQITSSSNSLSASSSTTNVQWNSVIQNAMFSSWYVQGITGWRVTWLWDAEFNKGTFRWELKAASGTFKGSLIAASGTFSWSLIAWDIHIPSKDATASFHVNNWGNAWWWTTEALFNNNNENAVSFIKNNGDAKFGGTLNVIWTTRLANILTLGSTTLQKSGKMVMEYYPSDGDTYIRAWKMDFWDDTNGFIIGIDQSDGGNVKAEFGNTSDYFKIDQTNGVRIRSHSTDLVGSSTIGGKLTSVLISQTDTKEELILKPIYWIKEVEIKRADLTVIDIVQEMWSTWTPVYITDYTLYWKTLTKDVYFQFDYSMSTSETSHQVKLQCDFNVIHASGAINPTTFTWTTTQEFTVLNSANYREILDTWTWTLKIDHSYFLNNNDLIQIRISRINTWLSWTNHAWALRLHRVRAYMA